MVLRVARDVRSLLLALCVQRHLLDRLPQLPPVQQRSLALDALDLFAPAAARLGVYALKHAIEERAFAVAYPTDAAHIADQMAHIHESFGHFLEPTAMQLAASLAKNGIPARVEGREKHAYSIFRKMQEKSISDISELYDLFALRVIVASPEQCYLALGMLHQLARPIQHRFKDYIAFPKPNGYQSLHTTVTRLPGMPEGAFVEVQIRTELMHRAAEYGIAAHWSYKEGASSEDAAVQSQLVAHLLRAGDAKEAEVLRDEIFALSPTGEVAGFPDGATPLDFAFWVHTNVGLCYRSARVNGRIVPMEYRLENGDVVEILQHPVPHPSPQWLQFLHTDGARTRLKRFIAAEQRRSIESLLPPTPKAIAPAPRRIRIGGAVIPLTSPASPLVTAELPMPIAFARCCAPQEKQGCRITGVVSRGVVRVHRKECRLLTAVNPERIVRVTWAAREKRVKVKKG
jgi:GTP pyrophosphokinase